MTTSSRLGFTLVLGMFIGAFSVMMDFGTTPAIPSHPQSDSSHFKAAMETFSSEQQEAVLQMVTNSSGLDIQVDNIEQLQDLTNSLKEMDLSKWASFFGKL